MLERRAGLLLTVSVVNYHSGQARMVRTLNSLIASAKDALLHGVLARLSIVVVNNGGELDLSELLSSTPVWVAISVLPQERNLGFGAAHNVAISSANSDFHLILNPDVDIADDAIRFGLSWLNLNESAVALSPQVVDALGNRSYLCREKPTVGILFLRSFAPALLRSLCSSRLERYEMREIIDQDIVVWDPPVISGCFMLFRTSSLKALKGFDTSYFLYFEDYDLSHRAAKLGRLAYVPAVRISHVGGGAARKGVRHIVLFCISALRYFGTYGWGREPIVRPNEE